MPNQPFHYLNASSYYIYGIKIIYVKIDDFVNLILPSAGRDGSEGRKKAKVSLYIDVCVCVYKHTHMCTCGCICAHVLACCAAIGEDPVFMKREKWFSSYF